MQIYFLPPTNEFGFGTWIWTRAYLYIILFIVNSIDILCYEQYYSNIFNIATINDSPQSTHVETADQADTQ